MLGDARLDAIVPVSDLDKAMSFYQDKLGLTLGEMRDDIPENRQARFRVGNSFLTLYESVGAGQSRHTLACFEVDDLASTIEGLRGQGVTFEEYDMPHLKTERGIATVGETRGAWFKDPDGNILALLTMTRVPAGARTS